METIGIVRRIDELGRIVIPKEIRRSMRLNEGDEMEILAMRDSLVLKKHVASVVIDAQARAIAKLLVESTGADVLLLSSSKVEIAEGKNKKMYADAILSDGFVKILSSRKTQVLHGDEVKQLFASVNNFCAYVVLDPILSKGDLIGTLALVLETMPSDVGRAYLHFSAEVLSSICE